MKHKLDYLLRKILVVKPAISVYARPDGSHAHVSLDCLMLAGEQFKVMGYREITPTEAQKRKLVPCSCMYKLSEGLK